MDILKPRSVSEVLMPLASDNTRRSNLFSLLTPRETEVLLELAKGASNAKIAAMLNITERTVKSHIGALLSKLGLLHRTEAVAFAWRNGLMNGLTDDEVSN